MASAAAKKLKNRIMISPDERGTFTKAAKSAGMGVQAYADHVLANASKYSPRMRRKAQFVVNARKFKH